ncbi:MAG: molybdopterin molybdotransferase MoeA [Desulfopila sp.]|jgi:molybdopterin molybdotransferase|nr:molybdopterin molybdotransferase MoeA [Desulfopila sp.]
MRTNPTLNQARKIIKEKVVESPTEVVSLVEAFGRVTAVPQYSQYACPEYTQSCYDGYVIPETAVTDTKDRLTFRVTGEIAAGDTEERVCSSGTALRIMTGALVPRGGWKVVPQEKCREGAGRVIIPGSVIMQEPSRIRRKGAELRKGALLVRKGESVTSAHLARLADSGIESVEVYRRPTVSFFCTGSELIDTSRNHQKGKKISSNRYLLSGLVRGLGAFADDCGAVPDTTKAMRDHLQLVLTRGAEIIVSTGGMGPGKYDLVEETFSSLGGAVCFNTLKLRPGKATLFGVLGHVLYFGLPGPPMAVHVLFHTLVKPALRAVQGVKRWEPKAVYARLWEDLHPGRTGMLQLLEAVTWEERGTRYVRLARKNEIADCYLFCPASGRYWRQGDLMKVESFESCSRNYFC